MKRPSIESRARSAFTLVEVILAILIIAGILVVVLYFYQQAAEVRRRAIDETEYITISRMFLEQVTGELRSARVVESQFAGLDGSSNSLSFITATLPNTTRWIVRTNEATPTIPTSDLKRIHYSLIAGTNLTDALGVQRSEELLGAPPMIVETNLVSTNTNTFNTNGALGANTNLNAMTNDFLLPGGVPLTDQIRFLQFRYWTGTIWTDSWGGLELPAGVEVTLGHEPIPRETSSEIYPFEFFRRVIYLPQSPHPGNKVEDTNAISSGL